MNGTYPGIYKGFVRDTDDPEKRGRIRVYCPQVMGGDTPDSSDYWLGWAEGCFPWIGGLSSLDFGVPPLKKDNNGEDVVVWIMFEEGDANHPVWIGVGIYAPTVDGMHSQASLAEAYASPGGTLMAAAASGDYAMGSADVSDFNPLKPGKAREVRLFAKEGVDIVIMSNRGGAIVIGPYGVQIIGKFIHANGRIIDAGIDAMVG